MSLKVKFRKARMISLPGDNAHIMLKAGPARMLKQSADMAYRNGRPTHALTHPILMDELFEVNCPKVVPQVPRRRPEWDDEYFARVKSAAYDDAIRARSELSELLKKLRVYVDNGVLEVVEDTEGLMQRDDIDLSDAEKAVANVNKAQAQRKIPKPSEIAKAAGA